MSIQGLTTKYTNPESDYQIIKTISKSNKTLVYKTKSYKNEKFYAMKKLFCYNNYDILEAEREIRNHFDAIKVCRYVCKIYCVYRNEDLFFPQEVCMILDYCGEKTIFDLLTEPKIATISTNNSSLPTKKIFKQLIQALYTLHTKLNLAHRDIKLENLMLKNSELKIIDFGFSAVTFNPDTQQTKILSKKNYTPYYVSPEVLTCHSGRPYGTSCDVWSAGVCFYMLLTLKPPFARKDNSSNSTNSSNFNSDIDHYMREKILNGQFMKFCNREGSSKFWDELDQKAKDLIEKIFVVDVEKRIKIGEILSHSYFE